MSITKGGLIVRYIWPWMRMVCRSELLCTSSADCSEAINLIEGISAEHPIANKRYDIDKIIRKATNKGIKVVIPPKSNLKVMRDYDKYLLR